MIKSLTVETFIETFTNKPPQHQARIVGPWYDDSDPEGAGETETEAKEKAIESLRGWKVLIDKFLKDLQDEPKMDYRTRP